eukprot:TRINITY_DN23616_c0_g1_i1.p1 TRINITY_DN23616_c0_g1~~TRINITY_DN23616_c0_g1_i1.p1  ORF type:complete len:767 (+),score=114.94 TRINITY_DN23616_c0_g1_i1:184-2484(+)
MSTSGTFQLLNTSCPSEELANGHDGDFSTTNGEQVEQRFTPSRMDSRNFTPTPRRTEITPPSSIVAELMTTWRTAVSEFLAKTSTLTGLIGAASIVFGDICLVFLAKPEFVSPETDKRTTWEPYVVLNCVAIAIGLMVVGLPSDLLLLAISSIFCALGIITTEELLGGLSNEGVVAVAALCCVSAAIDKTKALNRIMGNCLGKPTSPQIAIVRMAIPVVALGTVFNNTPLVAVMIPIVKAWSKERGLQASHFMMPLSFVTMLSACITTMGSSTNLLAVQLVPEANIAFLDLAPVGVVIMLVGVSYCSIVGPLILPANSQDDVGAERFREKAELKEDQDTDPDVDKYTVSFCVGEEGPLLKSSLAESGLYEAVSNTTVVRPQDGCDLKPKLEWGDVIVIANATATELASLSVIPGFTLRSIGDTHMTTRHIQRRRESFKAEPNHQGRFTLPKGKWVAGSEGGFAAKKRSLYEVVVAPNAMQNIEIRQMAANQGTQLGKLQVVLCDIGITLLAIRGRSCSYFDATLDIDGGDVLLVESLDDKLLRESDLLALELRVPDGVPPVSVVLHPLDSWRPLLAVCGLVITVFLGALEIAPLDPVAILAAMAPILLGTLTTKEMYAAINGPVLLTVAASFGVGAAVEGTGLASWLATSVMSVAETGGPTTVLAAVVLLTLSLGVVVSNNTTVILLAPLVRDICERKNMSIKMTMIAVIYAANLSFATPFSYQTNMMVMPHGQYVFMDYIKFGVPMMILCGAVALFATMAFWGVD